MTEAEVFLWSQLRGKRLDGFRFRRQHPIGPFIADFACMNPKLVVELDGMHHSTERARDAERDAFIEQQGYPVVRVTNQDVFNNVDAVLRLIHETLTARRDS